MAHRKTPPIPVGTGEKYCPNCHQSLPRTDFYKDKVKWDGLRPVCKTCDHERRNSNRSPVRLRAA